MKKEGMNLKEYEFIGFAMKICSYLTVKMLVLIERRYPKNHGYYRLIKTIYHSIQKLRCTLDNECLSVPINHNSDKPLDTFFYGYDWDNKEKTLTDFVQLIEFFNKEKSDG